MFVIRVNIVTTHAVTRFKNRFVPKTAQNILRRLLSMYGHTCGDEVEHYGVGELNERKMSKKMSSVKKSSVTFLK